MRIQTNIMAMTAYRMYNINSQMMAKSLERLSSGYRINRAADDAAGLAISEKMRAQIRGLNMASRNSQDALSMIRVAEGALDGTHAMLKRMKELAVNAATGTLSEFDRMQAAKEFDQLLREINDTAAQTNFNNLNLLDGSLSIYGPQRSAATAGIIATVNEDDPENITTAIEFDITRLMEGDEINVAVDGTEYSYTWKAGDTLNELKEGLEAQGLTVNRNGNTFLVDGTADVSGFKPTTAPTDHGSIRIQVGALAGEQLNIDLRAMNTKALGLDGINLYDQDAAGRAITAVDKAIDRVSDQRATLGAMSNRLEYKISNLDNTALNLSDAESRIRDVDIAKEMATFTKYQLLTQMSLAMLAQANAAAQNVLKLLTG